MSLPPQKFREIVFQMLFSHDMAHEEGGDNIPFFMEQLAVTRRAVVSAREKMEKILLHQPSIDETIAKTARLYELERIQRVELNILRLAVFEMLFEKEVHPKIAIAEAIRLSRKFSTTEASFFVNAVLDAVYKASLGEVVDQGNLSTSLETLAVSEEIAKQAAQEGLPKE